MEGTAHRYYLLWKFDTDFALYTVSMMIEGEIMTSMDDTE